jgi:hypothetical protein
MSRGKERVFVIWIDSVGEFKDAQLFEK